jgi:hypothetical protein
MCGFWAYSIMNTLIREYSENITYIDLSAIFDLGLISGTALGFFIAYRWTQKIAG